MLMILNNTFIHGMVIINIYTFILIVKRLSSSIPHPQLINIFLEFLKKILSLIPLIPFFSLNFPFSFSIHSK
jgi:hypothetical protein